MESGQETLFNIVENKSMHMNKAIASKTIYSVTFYYDKKYQNCKTTRNRSTAYNWQYKWQQKGHQFFANVSEQKG
ncbi:MAG: hypothetical protein J0M18_21575 [Ignavibacteria bacterium]|nr:hypothetical protein [Ignavibacteria bacterium]